MTCPDAVLTCTGIDACFGLLSVLTFFAGYVIGRVSENRRWRG